MNSRRQKALDFRKDTINTFFLVVKVTRTAYSIRSFITFEYHLVFGAHGTNNTSTRTTVMLTNKEGEGNETDLTLINLQ